MMLSVCLPSVMRVYCDETTEDRITQFSLKSSDVSAFSTGKCDDVIRTDGPQTKVEWFLAKSCNCLQCPATVMSVVCSLKCECM